jgi:hypothetical protein
VCVYEIVAGVQQSIINYYFAFVVNLNYRFSNATNVVGNLVGKHSKD